MRDNQQRSKERPGREATIELLRFAVESVELSTLLPMSQHRLDESMSEVAGLLALNEPLQLQLRVSRVVDLWEYYVERLMALTFRTKPEFMTEVKEKVGYEDLLQLDSSEDLVEFLADNLARELGRLSVDRRLDRFENLTGLDLVPEGADRFRVRQIVELCHVVTHRGGVADRK